MATYAVDTSVNQWGNGLAVRISKAVAKAAGVTEGTRVRITAQQGRIIVEKVEPSPSLDAMLAAFDPERHGGEVMAFAPVGNEVI
jgi:antitoxin component of MazEF toxin-antitoxin module